MNNFGSSFMKNHSRFPSGIDPDTPEPVEPNDLPQWHVGEECVIHYTVESGAGIYLDTWDWIALFKDRFTSLEDYVSFTWASGCRRSGIAKTCIMPDSTFWAPGKYVLLYVSAKQSILGVSDSFVIGERCEEAAAVEVADEVHEDDL